MITFRKLEEKDYELLHKWCQSKTIYEWFEQRPLSLEEIKTKYKRKQSEGKQELYIIQVDDIDTGYVQIYTYENDSPIDLSKYKNIYEFDLFIKEESQSHGIGQIIIKKIINKIEQEHHPDLIILRPFKENKKAIHCYQKSGFKEIAEYQGKDTLENEKTILLLGK